MIAQSTKVASWWVKTVGARLIGTAAPKKTCLFEFHVSRGGKMVDFAGYLMPVQYDNEGIAASHKHTRC